MDSFKWKLLSFSLFLSPLDVLSAVRLSVALVCIRGELDTCRPRS